MIGAPAGPGLPTGGWPAAPETIRRRQQQFAGVLAQQQEPRTGSPDTPAAARDAAENLVAIALVQPLLERLRAGSMAAPPFAPTQGERQFRAMLDAGVARQITAASRFPLVDDVARKLLQHARGPTA